MSKKLTAVTATSTDPAPADLIYTVDVSDTSGGVSGTSKKLTVETLASQMVATQGASTAKIAPWATMALLRADVAAMPAGFVARSAGHTTAGDGGHGEWLCETGAPGTYTHDGGITIVPSSGTGSDGSKALVRKFTGPIDARWFGAAFDGATNDSAEIISALGTSSEPWVTFPPGKTSVAAGMSLDGDKSIDGQFATLKAAANNDVFFDYSAEYNNYKIRKLENLYLDANGKTGVIGFQDAGSIRTEIRSGRGTGLLVDLAFDDVSFYNIIDAYQAAGGASGTSIGLRIRGGTLTYCNSFRAIGKACGQSLVANNSLTLPIAGQTFESCSFEACGVGTLVKEVYGSTWSNCHWESNGVGTHYTPSLTIEGVTMATAHDFYADNARVLLVRPHMGSTLASSAIRAINGSIVEVQKSLGTASVGVPLATCDATSRVILTGGGHRLYARDNQFEFNGYVESIDSFSAYTLRPKLVEDASARNLFEELGGNPWVPEPTNVAGEVVSHGSAIDSIFGAVKRVTFAASPGSTTVNRVTWTAFSGSAVAGKVQGVRVFVRAISGSGAFKLYSPRGGNNLVNCDFPVTTEWVEVNAGGTIGTISSNDTLIYFYPTDSAGLAVEVTALGSWSVDAAPDCSEYLRGHMQARARGAINAQTGTSYTFVAADMQRDITLSNAGATAVTVPTDANVPFPIGTKLYPTQIGAGLVTFTGDTGVTVNGSSGGSFVSAGQWKQTTLHKTGTNTWLAY